MEKQTKSGSIFGYMIDPQILQRPTQSVNFITHTVLIPSETKNTQAESELKLLGKQIKRDCF